MSRATEWSFDEGGEHYVYIMAHLVDAEIVAPVKIGISKHPAKRRKEVQADIHRPIVLVAKFRFWDRSHAFLVERAFHRTFDEYRVFGEWFDISPADAVGLMRENLIGFVDDVLQPDLVGDWYTARVIIGVPGHEFDCSSKDFGYQESRRAPR